MEQKSKDKKTLEERLSQIFDFFDKSKIRKLERKQRFEEKWGKYRLIKNERIRAVVQLLLFVAFFVVVYLVSR